MCTGVHTPCTTPKCLFNRYRRRRFLVRPDRERYNNRHPPPNTGEYFTRRIIEPRDSGASQLNVIYRVKRIKIRRVRFFSPLSSSLLLSATGDAEQKIITAPRASHAAGPGDRPGQYRPTTVLSRRLARISLNRIVFTGRFPPPPPPMYLYLKFEFVFVVLLLLWLCTRFSQRVINTTEPGWVPIDLQRRMADWFRAKDGAKNLTLAVHAYYVNKNMTRVRTPYVTDARKRDDMTEVNAQLLLYRNASAVYVHVSSIVILYRGHKLTR